MPALCNEESVSSSDFIVKKGAGDACDTDPAALKKSQKDPSLSFIDKAVEMAGIDDEPFRQLC